MSLLVDATTVFASDVSEYIASSGFIEKTGRWLLGQVGSPAVVTGHRTGLTARRFNGTTTLVGANVTGSSASDPYRDIAQSDCTWEMCMKSRSHSTSPSTRRTLFLAGYNDAVIIWLTFRPTGGFEVLYGTTLGGVLSVHTLSGPTLTEDAWTYVAMRKTVTSGTTASNRLNTYELFVRPLSGSFGSDSPDATKLNAAQSGLASTFKWDLGGNSGGPSVNAPFNYALHDLGPCRFSSGVRSLADLKESFLRLQAVGTVTADVTAPVVSNVTPTAGTGIYSTDTVGFDVTDAGGFRRVMLVADFAANINRDAIKEVIHDGTSWGPNYTGSPNARAAITNGYRYTIRRVDGWPSAPTITPFAIDTSGNENA